MADIPYGRDYPDPWGDHDDPYADVPPPTEPPDDDATPMLAAQVLSRSALRSLPDPEPLIHKTLDRGTLALLYGRWGIGKSFTALDWAACVATGRRWQGRPVDQDRALYVAAEGAFGLKQRTHAWEVGWRTTIADEGLDVLPRPVNLTNFAEAANLAALIDWAGYGFVVIDTLSRCMIGADENSAKDCGSVLDVLHRLRERTPGGRGVILAVHHAGKDGRTFRGSSVFEGGADTVYSMAVDQDDDGAIVLNREKRKDGPQTDVHRLRLDPIEGTESCTISVHRGVDKPERADRLLSTFSVHFAGTGASKSELRNVADLPSATFHRALSDLVKSGDLINTGTEKRPFYKAATE
ncbi:AAA family ATPase [Mycobacterium kubicae]|uniref:AAA family ATPase n=1 Tax=Mycobacterium kubicae TaxID=120959 RepID=UPI001640EE67|nr:AAA family ATPase [Mycobacterium kubicae]QNI06504.1 AAA family ATPase [Mycobacterium kubicae]